MSWKNILLKDDDYEYVEEELSEEERLEREFERARDNYYRKGNTLKRLKRDYPQGRNYDATREYEDSRKKYRKAERKLLLFQRDKKREKRIREKPLKEEAAKLKQEFERKKGIIIRDYLRYVDSYALPDTPPLTKLSDLKERDFIFRTMYRNAAKKAGIYGHSNIINFENYKDFDIDKKLTDFVKALKEQKELNKLKIRELYLERIRGRNKQ